jgi:XTP/dITP diphosphohydrolase
MRIFLASGNAHKVREFQALADDAAGGGRRQIELVAATAAGGMPPVVEDTGTFAGNARKKAVALQQQLPPEAWVLADDSGLCVDALDGAPGVDSAYYAGPQGDAAANLRKLTAMMRDVPEGRRGARYVCVLVLAGPEGVEQLFEGCCEGRLLRTPAGVGGFGYDPLFAPAGETASFAELGDAFKTRRSHRGRAWALLMEWLQTTLPDAAPRS